MGWHGMGMADGWGWNGAEWDGMAHSTPDRLLVPFLIFFNFVLPFFCLFWASLVILRVLRLEGRKVSKIHKKSNNVCIACAVHNGYRRRTDPSEEPSAASSFNNLMVSWMALR